MGLLKAKNKQLIQQDFVASRFTKSLKQKRNIVTYFLGKMQYSIHLKRVPKHPFHLNFPPSSETSIYLDFTLCKPYSLIF